MEAFKLSKEPNMLMELVQKESSFVETMKALVSYTGAFE